MAQRSTMPRTGLRHGPRGPRCGGSSATAGRPSSGRHRSRPSARLVQAIADLGGVEDHPIDIDIRADGVTVRLVTSTDDYFGMTRRDL